MGAGVGVGVVVGGCYEMIAEKAVSTLSDVLSCIFFSDQNFFIKRFPTQLR